MKAFLPFSVRAAICSTPTLSPRALIDGCHPAGVTPCQVIVHRHQVGALAGEGVQVQRQGGHQGLAFTGAHLGDLALVQGNAADQLDVVMALTVGALAGFTHGREGLRQQVIQCLAIGQACLEFSCLGQQLFRAQRFELLLPGC